MQRRAGADIDMALRERLAGLASFLTALESPTFEFGTWNSLEASGRGFILPSFVLSETVLALVQHARDFGWVRADLDWRAWMATPEARRLCEDPDRLARATPEQLAYLLTAVILGDHFADRSLETSYESGLLIGILRRAAVLASQTELADPGATGR